METIFDILQGKRCCTVAFTGRRTYRGEADDELRRVVRDLHERGFSRFLCGMSWGFDLAAGTHDHTLVLPRADKIRR